MSNATGGGTWTSSNDLTATVSGGVVSGVAAGSVIISYSVTNGCGTAVDTQMVTVNPLPVAGTITGATSLCVGSSTTLSNAMSGGVWGSSNTSVAIVSGGVTIGMGAGSAVISYSVTNSCGTTVDTQMVTVNPLPVAGTITGLTSVCVGSSITLSNATGGGTWTSSNDLTATVSGGVVSGVAAGSVIISYSVTNGCGTAVDTQVVTVNPLPVAGTITGSTSLCVGSSTTLSNAMSGGVWGSSNTSVAIVSGGVTIGMGAGSAIISYSVTNSCGTAVDTQMVTVNPLPVAGTITGLTSVCVGSSITLSNVTGGGVWTSSNTTIATVIGGVVNGVSAGSAIISYSVTNGCGTAVDTQMVTVNPLPVAGTITGATSVCVGSLITLSNATGGGSWTGSNTLLATVSGGLVSGASAGSVIISYSVANGCGTAVDTQMVAVAPFPVAGTITGLTSVCAGSQITLSNATGGGVWSSSNTLIATVSGGLVSGVGAGNATISYSVTTGCGTAVDTQMVTVNPASVGGAITGASAVCEGSSISLSDPATGGTWSVSPTGIVTVDAAGSVTGIAAGNAVVSYTTSGVCGTYSDTLTITVNALPVLSPISGTSAICTGSMVTLYNSTTGGVWTSSNDTFAVVSATGEVTGITAGAAIISYTYTNADGCASTVTFTVTTVNPFPAAVLMPGGNATICHGNPVDMYAVSVVGGLSYQWFNGTTAISGATDSTYSATVPGLYSVVISNGACTQALSGVNVVAQPMPIINVTGSNVLYTGSYSSYQWYFNGVAIPGAVSSIYTYTASGDYTVRVTDANGCAVLSFPYPVIVTVGVTEVNGAGMLVRIYPNPATSIVHIDASVAVNVVLVAADGRVVAKLNNAKDINISDYADGVYTMMIYNEDNMLLKAEKITKFD